jgi:hypothetical protein
VDKSGLYAAHDTGKDDYLTTTNALAWKSFVEQFTHSQLLFSEIASQITAETASSPDPSQYLCSLFMHPNTRYQKILSVIIAYMCDCKQHAPHNYQ